MNRDVALCSVVTKSVLDEFLLLKYSFELFHGTDYQWFVRCDRPSADVLSANREVVCRVFVEAVTARPDIEKEDFRRIVAQKPAALGDAWEGGGWNSVVFLDADLLFTAPVLSPLENVPGQILLAPNYYPPAEEHFAVTHGFYNSGFVYVRTRRFHEWWRNSFESQPTRWTDQAVLNDASTVFSIGDLPPSANIGFWRSPNRLAPAPLPIDCMFLHVHFFQPLGTAREWVERAFGLHCVRFLEKSGIPKHRALFEEIICLDRARWYTASLRLAAERASAEVGPGA